MKGIQRNRILAGNSQNADRKLQGHNQALSKTTVHVQRPKVGLNALAIHSLDC